MKLSLAKHNNKTYLKENFRNIHSVDEREIKFDKVG